MLNSSGVSPYSGAYNLTIDNTPPNAPILVFPSHNDTLSGEFTLSWNQASDTGSPLSDSLFVYSDSLITLLYKIPKTVTNHTDSLAVGSYYWRVRSYDSASNLGPFSATRKFNIQ